MSFGSDAESFYDYAQSLPDPPLSDSDSESGDSDYHDAQSDDYDSEHPGPYNWDYLHQLPSDSDHSPDGSDDGSDVFSAASDQISDAAAAFEFEFDEDHPGPLNWDFFYANQHLFYAHQSDRFSDHSSADSSAASSPSSSNILGPDGKLLESERERRRRLQLCFYCGGDHFRANCERLRAKERHVEDSADVSDGSTSSHGSVGSDNGSEYSAY